jgi:hypothetical protein
MTNSSVKKSSDWKQYARSMKFDDWNILFLIIKIFDLFVVLCYLSDFKSTDEFVWVFLDFIHLFTRYQSDVIQRCKCNKNALVYLIIVLDLHDFFSLFWFQNHL